MALLKDSDLCVYVHVCLRVQCGVETWSVALLDVLGLYNALSTILP